ncbi:hypothetical protein B0H34DRAFT_793128 [Crassisporium funariophilum]|nr:hypothetical protein B0H34DRAFT_793128 [Crassisporium funariophilum]
MSFPTGTPIFPGGTSATFPTDPFAPPASFTNAVNNVNKAAKIGAGIIAGACVASFFGLGICIAVGFYCYKKRQRRMQESFRGKTLEGGNFNVPTTQVPTDAYSTQHYQPTQDTR